MNIKSCICRDGRGEYNEMKVSFGLLNAAVISLMSERISTSETSENFYQTTGRSIPEESHVYTSRRENLQYHIIK
jgi:hypothetical protein